MHIRTSIITNTTSESLQESQSSLQETDALLDEFRRSLTSFHDLPLQLTSASSGSLHSKSGQSTDDLTRSIHSTSREEDLNLSIMLEKYSDKLVEMVGEKILNKMKI
jgi:flagellar capping protein FliD